MIALLVISMTMAFFVMGAFYVLGEWLDNRRKPPTRGDFLDFGPKPIEIGRRKWR